MSSAPSSREAAATTWMLSAERVWRSGSVRSKALRMVTTMLDASVAMSSIARLASGCSKSRAADWADDWKSGKMRAW
jgi:hypothetical protein